MSTLSRFLINSGATCGKSAQLKTSSSDLQKTPYSSLIFSISGAIRSAGRQEITSPVPIAFLRISSFTSPGNAPYSPFSKAFDSFVKKVTRKGLTEEVYVMNKYKLAEYESRRRMSGSGFYIEDRKSFYRFFVNQKW